MLVPPLLPQSPIGPLWLGTSRLVASDPVRSGSDRPVCPRVPWPAPSPRSFAELRVAAYLHASLPSCASPTPPPPFPRVRLPAGAVHDLCAAGAAAADVLSGARSPSAAALRRLLYGAGHYLEPVHQVPALSRSCHGLVTVLSPCCDALHLYVMVFVKVFLRSCALPDPRFSLPSPPPSCNPRRRPSSRPAPLPVHQGKAPAGRTRGSTRGSRRAHDADTRLTRG